jgi:hypothetical protein
VSDWRSLLQEEFGALALPIRADQAARLCTYLELLERWNQVINLTSLDPRTRVRRLVAEPVWAARRLQPSGQCLDIGSGNGSPAVPWCVERAFVRADLVESRARRATFLQVVVRRVGAREARVHPGRFEALRDDLGTPDWATVQGVRLDAGLLGRIRELSPGVRVVWMTRRPVPPEPPFERIRVPESDREVLVFAAASGTAPGQRVSEDTRDSESSQTGAPRLIVPRGTPGSLW